MHPLLAYCLKMLLCSIVLMGYYWVALRNERFHHWNRFYLLSAFVLSVVVPFYQFPLLQPEQPTAVVDMVAALPWNNVVIVPKAAASWSADQYVLLAAILVSAIMLLHLVRSVWKVMKLYRQNGHTTFQEVSVVITEESNAPFSFFKWLFWRSDIDPDSSNGQRMLKHELTHIHEKHSADKLFTELLLILFWINPIFWLMRRELYAIHEFLADQKAIEREDGAAFAAMILAAHQRNTPHPLSNPFFSSHLKRRLTMITTSHQPKYSYLRRISGLAIMLLTAFVLMISIEQAQAQEKKKTTTEKPKVEVKKSGAADKAPSAAISKKIELNTKEDQKPLFIYAGLEITEEQLDKIDPNLIGSVNVLKGENAVATYGEKGRNGVVVITTKAEAISNISSNEKVVMGYKIDPNENANQPKAVIGYKISPDPNQAPPIFLLNDYRLTEKDLESIIPDKIQGTEVIKGETAVKTFGEEGKNGVIKIIPKSSLNNWPDNTDKVFTKTEQMPSFPGGQDAWRRYLERNLQYPEKAQEKGTMGAVYVQFIVDKEGNISAIEALNNPGDGLAEEAIRIIAKGPRWEPAVQNTHIVVARTVQRITFRLE